jgi:hypothetical protein
MGNASIGYPILVLQSWGNYEDGMSGWRYDPALRRWEGTIGDWRATVTRAEQGDAWHPAIERVGKSPAHIEGPAVAWAHEGRAWCLDEIARQHIQRA